MAATFAGVALSVLLDSGDVSNKLQEKLTLHVINENENLLFKFKQSDTKNPVADVVRESCVFKDTDVSRVGATGYLVNDTRNSAALITLPSERERERLATLVGGFQRGETRSTFTDRTDESSATQYFQFYGYLSQQQNMMQDYIRTSTYQRAILANGDDFRGKVVLDVGAGSGILSFFAAQAGARQVYAVEASSMAKHAECLVFHNKMNDRIQVLPGKIEEIVLPEEVDVIISEPMGYMLFNERMLETYLHAKKWLKPGGRMFPTKGDLHIAPFTDTALYMEQMTKANFWYQQSFHGVDLTSLREAAVKEYFKQPIVDTFDVRICLAKSVKYEVNFERAQESDLHLIEIPLTFSILSSAELHGLAFWFDVAFVGSAQTVWLSTAPTQPLTHWYQVRCLFDTALFVTRGQTVTGVCRLVSNKRQSYDVEMELELDGHKVTNVLDLKNPFFRYTGQAPQPPPGYNETSPTEQYWSQASNDANVVTATVDGTTVAIQNGTVPAPPQTMEVVTQHHYQIAPTQLATMGNGTGGKVLPSMGSGASAGQATGLRILTGAGTGVAANGSSMGGTGVIAAQQVMQQQVTVPTSSIGGGISPALFNPQQQVLLGTAPNHFALNNSLMIGDYVTPAGNLILQPCAAAAATTTVYRQ